MRQTNRSSRLLALISAGLTHREIARRLHLSISTVRAHVSEWQP